MASWRKRRAGRHALAGRLCSCGAVRRGMRNGLGVYIWPDDAIYCGQYHNSAKHGHGAFVLPEESHLGQWSNELKHGHGVSISESSAEWGFFHEGMHARLSSHHLWGHHAKQSLLQASLASRSAQAAILQAANLRSQHKSAADQFIDNSSCTSTSMGLGVCTAHTSACLRREATITEVNQTILLPLGQHLERLLLSNSAVWDGGGIENVESFESKRPSRATTKAHTKSAGNPWLYWPSVLVGILVVASVSKWYILESGGMRGFRLKNGSEQRLTLQRRSALWATHWSPGTESKAARWARGR